MKAALHGIVRAATNEAGYTLDRFEEAVQRRKTAAQAEIDTIVTRTVIEAGIASLTASPKTLEDKNNGNG